MEEYILKGNIVVDALIGILIVCCSFQIIGVCVQSYYKVESERVFFTNWQLEEDVCEIWCDSFWFYDD